MAQPPTIHKFEIALADLDRDLYDNLSLTVARHPSETATRMLARVLACALNADEAPSFGRGLSEADDADLWSHDLEGRIRSWIDVGEPTEKRIRKAIRQAERVRIYAFTRKAEHWWAREGRACAQLGAEVLRVDGEALERFAETLARTTRLSMTVSDGSVLLASDDGSEDVGIGRFES